MKVWELQDGFGLKNLVMGERPDPKPGPGEVLVAMRAASLNFRDTVIINGLYGLEQPLPLIPISDGAGEVVEIGSDVSRFQPGDRVTPAFHQGWESGLPTLDRLSHAMGAGTEDGVMSEYRVVPEAMLVRSPAHLSDPEAACLPCAALTAWAALVEEMPSVPGEIVLILGTGGVSVAALQFAVAMGLRTIVTSSSDEKLARVTAMGANHVINYKQSSEWGEIAKDLTGGIGVDHVIEVGGAGTLTQSMKALKIGGRISLIGVLSGTATKLSIAHFLMMHVRMQGITVSHRDAHQDMVRFLETAKIHPIIDRTFAFDEMKEALEYMIARRHFGKIAIDFS